MRNMFKSACIIFSEAEKVEVKGRCCSRWWWWWELIYLLLVLLRSKTWHLLQLHLTSSFPWLLRVSTFRYNTTNNRLEAKIMRHVFLYNRCRYSHEKTFYHSPHGKHLSSSSIMIQTRGRKHIKSNYNKTKAKMLQAQ